MIETNFDNCFGPLHCVCRTKIFRRGREKVWRAASLRSAPHQQTPEPVYIVVDKLVHCDPNMYS